MGKNTNSVMVSLSNISVSVGLIINPQNEILIARRLERSSHAHLWEFPGGKIESHEDDFSALCREMKEEVGVDVLEAKPFMEITHDYADYRVTLHVWRVSRYLGEPRGVEGQPICWVPINNLPQYDFPAANDGIVSRLLSQLNPELGFMMKNVLCY